MLITFSVSIIILNPEGLTLLSSAICLNPKRRSMSVKSSFLENFTNAVNTSLTVSNSSFSPTAVFTWFNISGLFLINLAILSLTKTLSRDFRTLSSTVVLPDNLCNKASFLFLASLIFCPYKPANQSVISTSVPLILSNKSEASFFLSKRVILAFSTKSLTAFSVVTCWFSEPKNCLNPESSWLSLLANWSVLPISFLTSLVASLTAVPTTCCPREGSSMSWSILDLGLIASDFKRACLNSFTWSSFLLEDNEGFPITSSNLSKLLLKELEFWFINTCVLIASFFKASMNVLYFVSVSCKPRVFSDNSSKTFLNSDTDFTANVCWPIICSSSCNVLERDFEPSAFLDWAM